MALSPALKSCSGRLMRSQKRLTGLKASLAVRFRSWNCSTCCSTGSGCRQAKASPGRNSTGMRFTVAVPAAVTMFRAPGPMELVTAKMRLRLDCLAKPMAAWAMPCSLCPG